MVESSRTSCSARGWRARRILGEQRRCGADGRRAFAGLGLVFRGERSFAECTGFLPEGQKASAREAIQYLTVPRGGVDWTSGRG